jgi:hypothetical protein
LDFAEKNGYIRGVVREIIHDSGRWVLFYLYVIWRKRCGERGRGSSGNEDLRERCGAWEVLGVKKEGEADHGRGGSMMCTNHADYLVVLPSPLLSSETHTGTSSERKPLLLPRESLPDHSSTVERKLP